MIRKFYNGGISGAGGQPFGWQGSGGSGGGGGGGTANNGLSVSGGAIVLGNDVGDTSAIMLSDREIPMGNFNLNFTAGDNVLQIFSAAGVSAFNNVTLTAGILSGNGQLDLAGSGAGDQTPKISLTDITGGDTWRIRIIAGVFHIMVGNDSFLLLDKASGIYRLGDTSGVGNSSKLVINDSISLMSGVVGNNTALSLDQVNKQYGLGDLGGSGNVTKIVIDDTAQEAQINALNGININGTPGFSGTVSPVTSITVVGGIVTAVS